MVLTRSGRHRFPPVGVRAKHRGRHAGRVSFSVVDEAGGGLRPSAIVAPVLGRDGDVEPVQSRPRKPRSTWFGRPGPPRPGAAHRLASNGERVRPRRSPPTARRRRRRSYRPGHRAPQPPSRAPGHRSSSRGRLRRRMRTPPAGHCPAPLALCCQRAHLASVGVRPAMRGQQGGSCCPAARTGCPSRSWRSSGDVTKPGSRPALVLGRAPGRRADPWLARMTVT
jgi:hypothetical protein